MKVLVTGADGFVGLRLVPRLLADGHETVAAVHPHAPNPAGRFGPDGSRVSIVPLELPVAESIRSALAGGFDAVVHLAAVASGADARKDPGAAWRVNAEGTAALAEALAERAPNGRERPLLLLISTAEVYGAGPPKPRVETDPVAPTSPYAATKVAAEIAATEVGRRTGLRVITVRPFPHTGPGQDERYVVPGFARRIRMARQIKAPAVRVGNLDVRREVMHVEDVVDAYSRILHRGKSGDIYNVASGREVTLQEVFERLCDIIGYRAIPEPHPSLMRAGDIPYLVGDATRLRAATGWQPRRTLEQTLQEVVDAQAD